MPLCGCQNGVLATALVALLVLPAQYYVPELAEPAAAAAPRAAPRALHAALRRLPPLDLLASAALLLLAGATYLAEWIQRKIMERRIVKMSQYVRASVERLRAWDAQQEQLEAALRLAASAAAEYSLLLYLVLRPRRAACAPPPPPPPPPHAPAAAPDCCMDKGLHDGLAFFSPAVET